MRFKSICKKLVLSVLMMLFILANLEAGKVKQALLVPPDYLIRSVAFSLERIPDYSKISIIADNFLSGEYAKIILHSYGFKNRQIEILPSIQALKLEDVSGLDIFGKLSSQDQDYLRQKEIKFSDIANLENRGFPVIKPSNSGIFKTAIIVLGTGPLDESTPSLDMVRRVETGIALWRSIPDALLFFTGGKTAGPISEAKMMALIAFSRGVPRSDVFLEEESRSTVENAQFTVKIIDNLPVKKFLLVSRPTHLKRAERIFKQFPEFWNLQVYPSRISKEEIIANLEEYLAYKDSDRVRQILKKISKE